MNLNRSVVIYFLTLSASFFIFFYEIAKSEVWKPLKIDEPSLLSDLYLNKNSPLGHRKNTRKILVIHSYNQGYLWTDLLNSGIESVLKSYRNIEYRVEYMDGKHYDSPDHLRYLAGLYRRKYANERPDCIICTDNLAYNFVQKNRHSIFPGVPLVFTGLNNVSHEQIKQRHLTTGIMEATSEKETLELALSLHPWIKTIAVITDNTATGRLIRSRAARAHASYKKRCNFLYYHDCTLKDLLERVQALPSDSIILHYIFSKDKDGRIYPLRDSLSMVSELSGLPVYTFWSFYVGSGATGGKVINGRNQGGKASEIALEILKGTSPASIGIMGEEANSFIFDHKMIRKFRIMESALPDGSIIINQKLSFYERYPRLVWTTILVFSILVLFIVLLFINIKVRARVEGILRISESKYRQLYESMLDGYARFNPDGNLIEFNSSFQKIIGYKEDELIGKHYLEITAPTWRQLQHMIIRDQIEGRGYSDVYEKEYIRPDGTTVPVELRTYQLFDSSGQYDGYWSIVRDISDRKFNEKRIEEQNRILSEHNRELALTALKLEKLNDELMESQTSLIQSRAEVEKMNQTLEQRVVERTRELRETIDTLKLTQKQLIEFEKMASLGGLVAGVSHEMSTPIGVSITAASYLGDQISDFTDLFKKGDFNNSSLERFLKIAEESSSLILKNLKRAGELVNNFKEVAVDQSDEKIRDFNLNSYVDDVIYSLSSVLKKDQHRVEVHFEKNIILHSYPGVFFQIISNLIINSVKHGFEGMQDRAISLDFSVSDKDLVFIYGDNGRGMSEEEKAKVFEPFYTTKRGDGGTGLGMHIVYNLVTQKLKGTIQCGQSPEPGVEFIIKVPLTAIS